MRNNTGEFEPLFKTLSTNEKLDFVLMYLNDKYKEQCRVDIEKSTIFYQTFGEISFGISLRRQTFLDELWLILEYMKIY